MTRERIAFCLAVWAVCGVVAVCGAGVSDIRPLPVPGLGVVCGPGDVQLPDGTQVKLLETTLMFDPPAIRTSDMTDKVPHHSYAGWFDPWQPWPARGSDGKSCVITLLPNRDEKGTPILGGLYRSVVADSVVVTSADGSKAFDVDKDFKLNSDWGQVATLGGLGEAGAEVKASCKYALQRLDLVQALPGGKVAVKKGESVLVCPQLPEPDADAVPLAGVYIAPWQVANNPNFVDGSAPRATGDYAITEHEILPINPARPVPPINPAGVLRTLTKLRNGEPVKIALMGDSITLGAEAGHWWENKFTDEDQAYRGRVIAGLRHRFPKAEVEPIEAYKGGTTTSYALQVFEKTVKPAQPDLAIIAFGANDAASSVGKGPKNPPELFREQMLSLVRSVKQTGAEAVLVVGMQMHPWHPSGVAQRQPEYRKVLLDVAEQENVAVADVYSEWMNLPTRGIPQFSQLHNWINHPGSFGHELYADVILRLFPATGDLPTAKEKQEEEKAEAAKRPAMAGLLTQPINLPTENWSLAPDQPLPSFEEIMKRPAPELPVYGLYTWCGEYRTHRESIKKVGWPSLRVAGPMDDETMRMLCEDGPHVMKTLGMREADPSGGKKNRENYDSDEPFIQDYLQGVERYLGRYGPGGTFFKDNPDVPVRPVMSVEIWNEPNFQYMIPPRDGVPRQQLEAEREVLYAKVQTAAYKTIKAKWPQVTVVAFGAGGASAGDMRFIQHVHEQDESVGRSYDVLSTHPYLHAPPEGRAIHTWGGYSIATSLDTIRGTLAKHRAAGKPIWYTEVGWPVSKEDGGRFDMETARIVSPMMQAANVCRMYLRAMRLGVDRVHIMFATDTDNYNAGFFLRDGSWRPSAHAVQTLIRVLPNPRFIEAISDGEDGLYVYRLSPDGKEDSAPVVMAWNVVGPTTFELPCEAENVVVTDMLGKSVSINAAEGKLTLEIGPYPVYVRSAKP